MSTKNSADKEFGATPWRNRELLNRLYTDEELSTYDIAESFGCPEGNDRLCDGPLGPRLPCPSCIDGRRSSEIDEFDVWDAVVTEDRA